MIELVVTMAVAAVLLMLAVPNFRPFIQGSRMVTQINELHTSLNLARSEAIKRGASITVCASLDSASCTDTGAWHGGWLVFVDENADGAMDSGTDEVLRVHNSLTAGSTLAFSQGQVTYAGTGLATSGANGTFTLCDARGSESASGIVVGSFGRARPAIGSDGLSCGS